MIIYIIYYNRNNNTVSKHSDAKSGVSKKLKLNLYTNKRVIYTKNRQNRNTKPFFEYDLLDHGLSLNSNRTMRK